MNCSPKNKQGFILRNFHREHLLAIANFFADWPGTCLLYSGREADSAKTSYLSLFPFESLTIQGLSVCYQKGPVTNFSSVANPWDALERFVSSQNEEEYLFGFIGYEMGAFSDPDKRLPYTPALTPDAYWQRCAIVVRVDHAAHEAHVAIAEHVFPLLKIDEEKWAQKLLSPQEWISMTQSAQPLPCQCCRLQLIENPNRRALYLEKIEAVKDYIRAGDVYQVNLSQSFVFKGKRRSFDLFAQMAALNPAPFSAYLYLKDFAIVSTSPERFLKKEGERLETRPIKGTIHRGKNLDEDRLLKTQLLSSSKEKAELLMITDLMRNDLGKVSQTGSVIVPEIWRCEEYRNVFHLLSIIQSQALPELSAVQLIRSCFPGGSITGCPKLRAMEIIAELEQEPRGLYTGSMGYIQGQGAFDLNIAIRTLVFMNEDIHLQLGSGIVIDSDPELEYQETLAKGASLFQLLKEGP